MSATNSCQTERQIQQDVHCMCLSTMPLQKLQMLEKEQLPPNKYPNLNAIEIPCLGSDTQSYFETFVQSPNQLLNQKSHWRKYWSIFCRARSCPEF